MSSSATITLEGHRGEISLPWPQLRGFIHYWLEIFSFDQVFGKLVSVLYGHSFALRPCSLSMPVLHEGRFSAVGESYSCCCHMQPLNTTILYDSDTGKIDQNIFSREKYCKNGWALNIYDTLWGERKYFVQIFCRSRSDRGSLLGPWYPSLTSNYDNYPADR